jgi:hypothetical protein
MKMSSPGEWNPHVIKEEAEAIKTLHENESESLKVLQRRLIELREPSMSKKSSPSSSHAKIHYL